MGVFKLPLSGDVVQGFSFFPSSQFGLINITVGQSTAPDVEKDVLSDVGSYGKQIGQIADALLAVIEHFETENSSVFHGSKEITKFKNMLVHIAEIKEEHRRPAHRPRHVPSE